MFHIYGPPIRTKTKQTQQLFSDKQTPIVSSQEPGLLLKNWTYFPYNSLPRLAIAISHTLRSHWCCTSVSGQDPAQHGWTYLNVCTVGTQKHHYLVVVTAKASKTWGGSYQYQLSSRLICWGKDRKKKKEKEKPVQHLAQSLQFLLAVKQYKLNSALRASCWSSTNRDCSDSTKQGENPDKFKPERNISRCTVLIDLVCTTIFLEVWPQVYRWLGTPLNLFNFSW